MSSVRKVHPQFNQNCVMIVGKESAGKSQLVASLTGQPAYASNFRGSTVNCEFYRGSSWIFVDTPGILRRSDTLTTSLALAQLAQSDRVLLVVRGTRIDEDLADLLPLIKGKQAAVVVTFWDKVYGTKSALTTIDAFGRNGGTSFIPVDARNLTDEQRTNIMLAVGNAKTMPIERMRVRAGWQIEAAPTLLDQPFIGPALGIVMLLMPAIVAVWAANNFANFIDPQIQPLLTWVVELKAPLPSLAQEILFGKYGFVTMGPLLFVWSVPTIVLFAVLLGCYKASGLLDRITTSVHPLMRPVGLSGRDLVRVIMGFGCNVPAVVSTRSCSRCSRGTCISAIAFGAACSYQLGATLSVFAAAHRPYLVVPYLLSLSTTTLIYVRLTAPREARSKLNVLMVEGRTFLQFPRAKDIWRESRSTLVQFFRNAIPIFFLITVIASILNWLNIIEWLGRITAPLMALFRLPASAALPVLMASIRKDGILLFAQQDTISTLSSVQLITGVYLAGVLLPCLVTILTISKEVSLRFALKLLVRQATFAVLFSLVLAWAGTMWE